MPVSYTTWERIAQFTGELDWKGEWPSGFPARSPEPYSMISKTGSYCIDFDSTSNLFQSIPIGCHFRIGFYFRLPTIPATGINWFFRFPTISNISEHGFQFDWDDEELDVVLDGGVVGSIPFTNIGLAANTWMRFGVDFDPSQFNALYVNGERYSYSTVPVTDAEITGIVFGSAGVTNYTFDFFIDDVYIEQETKGWITFPECPPDRIFLASIPTSAGSFSDWTPYGSAQNYQNVQSFVSPVSHNYTNSSGIKDTFVMSDIVLPVAPSPDYWKFNAVIVLVIARKYNVAQSGVLSPCVYDGWNTKVEEAHIAMGPDYLSYWSRFEREPDGSSWSETDYNFTEVGYLSGGTF